jgi:hypothetical protein
MQVRTESKIWRSPPGEETQFGRTANNCSQIHARKPHDYILILLIILIKKEVESLDISKKLGNENKSSGKRNADPCARRYSTPTNRHRCLQGDNRVMTSVRWPPWKPADLQLKKCVCKTSYI